jgi:hypothetical protein
MAQKIQIRRGVEAQRALVTPDAGELLFTTDQKQLFVGDGATAGGWLVGGGSAAVVVKHAGTAAIAAGADSVTVTGLALPSVPAQVLVTVRKHTGGANLFATVRGDSITTGGFTADLSGATDAATYALDYLLIL